MTHIETHLRPFTFPMHSVTEYEDFSDLAPLKDILAGVRIVALGEATHGTREFFQLKHRLTRFLVEQMGFSAFTIEAGVVPCRNIDDYVRAGKGDRAKALASQRFWTWDTEEVTALIEWMREHNLRCERGRECRFFGFDIQILPEALETAERLIAQAGDRDFCAWALPVLTEMKEKHATIQPDDAQPLIQRLLGVYGYVIARELPFTVALGGAYEDLRTALRIPVEFALGMMGQSDMLMRGRGRDLYMAENVTRILDDLGPQSKIVVWAHNAHIAIDDEWENMGYCLRNRYGSQYYAFALSCTRGRFQARTLETADDGKTKKVGALCGHDAGEPEEGSWEAALSRYRPGDFYIDVRGGRSDEVVAKWAAQQLGIRAIGAVFDPSLKPGPIVDRPPLSQPDRPDAMYEKCSLSERYDGIFHIENTTSAIPNPTGRRA